MKSSGRYSDQDKDLYKEFYHSLGLRYSSSTIEDVKWTHKLLTMAWHPDRFPEGQFRDEALKRMQDINVARDYLVDYHKLNKDSLLPLQKKPLSEGRRIISKFNCKCWKCKKYCNTGTEIIWFGSGEVYHTTCKKI